MGDVSSLDGVLLHRVDTVDDACAFMSWLSERRPILAIDTETTGLEQSDRVRLVQFGDAYQGWTIRWDRWSGVAYEALERYTGPIVMHNASFDVKMLEKEGITFAAERVHDTMVMAHCLDPTRRIGLKELATVLIDRSAGMASRLLDETMTQNDWTWATIPYEVPVYSIYAAMDTVLTARLFTTLYPAVMAECPRSYDLEMAFSLYVMRKEKRGVALDVEFTEKAYVDFNEYMATLTSWVAAQYGVRANKDEEVVARLQQDGLELTKLTPSGQRLSLDKEVLNEIIESVNHPLAEAVLRRRQAQKLASTYLSNFRRYLDEDGLLRPSVKSVGARTGRQSISKPPLQTLPRRSEENPLAITVRNCIIPRPGNVLVMTDWNQIEMRIIGHLGQDMGMRDAFASGDFFLAVARELYNDPTMTRKDPRRQLTKNAMYALGYGAGARKIALTAGVELAVVQEFLDSLGTRFPGIRRVQNDIVRETRETFRLEGRAYVTSPLTGRRHYADDGKGYTLLNYLAQGTAAEVLKMKSLEIEAAGIEYVVLDVHDEIIADVPIGEAREVSSIIERVMNDRELFSIPLTAESEFGFRWGEKGSVTLDQLEAA